MALAHFTDDDFASEVLKSNIPVLVDFYADWCGPCKQLAPIIEELATEYDGKIKTGKLDVDVNNATASEYGVMSIPTLIFFKDGKIVEKVSGFHHKDQLKAKLDALL